MQRLSEDAQWRASRFGQLEDFIFDFLVGGGRTAAEALRLKLQTPLFVADALLAAAGQQLAAELATAQEVGTRQQRKLDSKHDSAVEELRDV